MVFLLYQTRDHLKSGTTVIKYTRCGFRSILGLIHTLYSNRNRAHIVSGAREFVIDTFFFAERD